MFFALMPTESGDAISSSIDCAIEQLYKFLHVRLVARVGIIDRSHAFKNGLMDSTVFANNAKLIITCFEHLLFAGKRPGTKDVQDSIQLILKQLHKCTSDMMVRAIFVAETARFRGLPEFADAITWLSSVLDNWRFYVTSAGFPGIMPSAQCIEAFNRILKVMAPRMSVKLNVFMFETVPEILKLAGSRNSQRVVYTRPTVGLQFMVSRSQAPSLMCTNVNVGAETIFAPRRPSVCPRWWP